MKLSNMLEKLNSHQYVLGGIFSWIYMDKNKDIYFVSMTKIQESNKNIDYTTAYNEYKEFLEKSNYKVGYIGELKGVVSNLGSSNQIGIYIKVENDLKIDRKKLFDKIFLKIVTEENIEEFVRGMWECAASVDVSANLLSRDLNFELGENAPFYFAELTRKIFKGYPMNINPRHDKPSAVTRAKNTQFRLRLTNFLTLLGTSRQPIIATFEENKHKYKGKRAGIKNISFTKNGDVHYYNLVSYLKLTKEDAKNIDAFEKEYAAQVMYKNGQKDRGKILRLLRDSEEKEVEREISRKIPDKIIKEILLEQKYTDPLTGLAFDKKDSSREMAIDNIISHNHHIVPFEFKKIISKLITDKKEIEKLIHSKENIIALSPQTHDKLHRSSRADIADWLDELFKKVKPWLQSVGSEIDIEKFRLMY